VPAVPATHLGIEAYLFCKFGVFNKAFRHPTLFLAVLLLLLGVFSVGVHEVNPFLKVFFGDPHVVVVSQSILLVAAPKRQTNVTPASSDRAASSKGVRLAATNACKFD
jgi:hypothetical protein